MISWDCHAHAFGPLSHPIAERGYDPPEASATQGWLAARLSGLDRLVWVQPSIYSADNGAVLDALQAAPAQMRAVIAPPDDGVDLASLHAYGVRGLRLNLVSRGGNTIASLAPHLGAMRALGWHVAAFLDAADAGLLGRVVDAVGLPVVLDHFGGVGARGLDDPGCLDGLMTQVAAGRVWVKLSAPVQLEPWPHPRVGALVARLLGANADRIVFGSNWPHVGAEPRPDGGALVRVTRGWIEAAGIAPQRVFEANAEALYV